MPEGGVPMEIDARIIRTAVDHPIPHLQDRNFGYSSGGIVMNDAADTTHLLCVTYSV